jgi:tetratricopeptide (TPR) repeat protein
MKGKYRQARAAFETALSSNPADKDALKGMATIKLAVEEYASAASYLKAALDVAKGDVELWTLLGDALYGLKDFNGAVSAYSTGLTIVSDGGGLNDNIEHDFSVKMGRALYQIPEKQDYGIALIERVIQKTDKHLASLTAYALAAHDRGKEADAIGILLRAIIMDQENKEVRKTLAQFIKEPEGLKRLLSQFEDRGPSIAPAFAFLATVIRDYSAIDQCIQLYEEVIKINPTNAAYALNYVHALEIQLRYEDGMKHISSYLERNGGGSVGGVSNKAVCDTLKTFSTSDSTPCYDTKFLVEWRARDPSYATVYRRDAEGKDRVDYELPVLSSKGMDLDLLALHFTAVKLLFVEGRMNVIPPLINIIEPARVGQNLHLTTIRNEQAYYSCIAQLMGVPFAGEESVPAAAPRNDIFVFGDSHILSLAWRGIKLREQDYLLRPVLATGVKAWHLRDESTFYPKANFYNALKTIPDNAKVIFVFGEIDCRDGILRAIEKDRYTDLDDGIKKVVDIYMRVLNKVIVQKKIEAYIHPVNPVLNETRSIVMKFNAYLEASVRNNGAMKWLDFVEHLLSITNEESVVLNPKYALDGTHLHPSYAKDLLEPAINFALRS